MLEQASVSVRTQFEFGERHLGYGLDGDRRHWRFAIDYADLPKRSGFALSTSAWLRRLGSLACAFGVLQAGWAAWNGASMLGGMVLGVIGVICLLLHVVSRREFTVLRTSAGDILIVRDRQHDQILRALRERRRARILELHGVRVKPRALLESGLSEGPSA